MRIGFVGIGDIARHHAKAVDRAGSAVVAACASSMESENWGPFLEVAPHAQRRSGIESVVGDPQVEALVICLPWRAIVERIDALLACPLPSLIEKPLSLTSKRLEEAVAGKDVDNKRVGFNRRFYEPVTTLKERINKGGLVSFEISISEQVERLVEKYGPTIVTHIPAFTSIHTFDLINYLFGPVDVIVTGGEDNNGFSTRHACMTSGAVMGWLALNPNDPTTHTIKCRFKDGTAWVLSPLETLVVYVGNEVFA